MIGIRLIGIGIGAAGAVLRFLRMAFVSQDAETATFSYEDGVEATDLQGGIQKTTANFAKVQIPEAALISETDTTITIDMDLL